MTGLLRFFLAAIVVASHLINTHFYLHLGYYAVRAFFILSSFAMTAALHEHYRFDGARFWSNRFLKLAPTYFVVCALTSLAIGLFPQQAAYFMPRWAHQASLSDLIGNIAIVPIVFLGADRLIFIEPAWSLAVEIVMYAALFLFVARNAAFAFYGFALGFCFHLVATLSDAPFEQIYFSIEGAILSFSIGALAYFWSRQNSREIRPAAAFFVLTAWLVNLFAEGALAPIDYPRQAGFYVNILLSTLLCIALTSLKAPPKLRRIDGFLGDLSYPVFLVQWLGGFVGFMLLSGAALRGWTLLAAAVTPILLIAAALASLQRRYVEPLRGRIRRDDMDGFIIRASEGSPFPSETAIAALQLAEAGEPQIARRVNPSQTTSAGQAFVI
ncbi:acyltransferase family protein [Methylocystis parvus]|uniref:acyltransferase family protein n=1 Tax=Methylocystis parvus TaxID=134 RepID=UPI003C7569B0